LATERLLSTRERDVLRLLTEGRIDREIAEALSLSYRTVTTHVTAILTKLDVDSRTAAAVFAVRNGLA
jgi:DNA-binding NarL/FixJ family response regulator